MLSIREVIIFSLAVTFCNASCVQVYGSGVNETDKQSVLGWHNYYRALVQGGAVPGQPKAKNVYPLAWDNALAAAAQNIANSCSYGHVPVKDGRFYVGQNIFWSGKPDANWAHVVKVWFDENKNFVYPNQSNGVTGHYTQIVWANTKFVGCGYTWYRNETTLPYTQRFYVCNYGPGGNIGTQAPYEV